MDCGERDGFRGMRVRALLFFIVLVTLAHDGLGLDQLGSEKLLIFSIKFSEVSKVSSRKDQKRMNTV